MRRTIHADALPKAYEFVSEHVGSKPNTIDLFCGSGGSVSSWLRERTGEFLGFDLDQAAIDTFRKNHPDATIKNQDSVEWLRTLEEGSQECSLIFIDNPLSIYGENGAYCEHFETLENVHKLVGHSTTLVVNVVPRPYGATSPENAPWMARRCDFYGCDDASDLACDKLMEIYTGKFAANGISVKASRYISRAHIDDLDYIYFYCFHLSRAS
ncbi:MAG: class I SAM-dependent methyltransferase [Magnetococcales bacterium]|nr:class I SAM-dependent methyltransferase [Magnetococcales bacterium]